ncbi:MAG: IS1634 family transposase [Nitrospirota bacterium]|nr:IS1634 family transposase [Nitrospirota bacterium]
MYIQTVPNRNSPPCILLRQDHRVGKKVVKRTLANLSNWPEHVVDGLRILLKGESITNLSDSFTIARSLPHGHVAAVLYSLKQLGLHQLMASRPSKNRERVVAMIVARILDPQSKLATVRGFRPDTLYDSLAQECRLGLLDQDDLYEAMDWLLDRQDHIEKKLAARHLQERTFVLYDLTSTWYEGRTCPLAKLGHPRDKKKGKLQIEFGLLCDMQGRPIAVEVFEGNTGDPATVASQIQKIRCRFGLERVVIVGDRGMLTDARIKQELQGVEGLEWISALRGPAIKKLMENQSFTMSLFDDQNLAEITSPDYPGERLMVCRNPMLAEDRRRTRQELLEATERLLEPIAKATQRQTKPLRGKDNIGLRVGRVINKYKVGKHFELTITNANFTYQRKSQQIKAEAVLDGFYVIRTSVPAELITPEDTISIYKKLSVVERAFRCMKTVDLKVRPIFHRLEKRVRAHIFLCMLAYYVEWHMRQLLAPILFEDDDREWTQRQRRCVVAPAQRSEKAKRKASSKRTDERTPVHSFHTLLKDLATITRNEIQPNLSGSPTFHEITTPTSLQSKALDLLSVKL